MPQMHTGVIWDQRVECVIGGNIGQSQSDGLI